MLMVVVLNLMLLKRKRRKRRRTANRRMGMVYFITLVNLVYFITLVIFETLAMAIICISSVFAVSKEIFLLTSVS